MGLCQKALLTPKRMTTQVLRQPMPLPQLSALTGGGHGQGSKYPELTAWCRGDMRGVSILRGSSWTLALPRSVLPSVEKQENVTVSW
ncbi:RGD1563912 (predicted), isoform CRA_b [Rattus norvegicus]|uniref:RGD1563912 (Predicted), isoform CRA_b n=2 Tax=Rattus norvegicus TaxID=10116 RepID=Q52KR9_RAT|nr:RGD1563912 protein [Rattus norvegicus]EDL96642.1 RGD1563912 (predicted), isoform CRA_b [Rattus norvegicus]EDL96643.1 RGD1563912 (predicted), isoform CRA_b [Rattus norvegicus]EDL96644.1 RGD1563912 (predicted), isoform CRA_b [Rattus norvegicus]EDL96645.1 RGD1563912 (predicted), isoform CRA_b [Rattus norvegicus]|eukprot:NP_001244940.1 small nucleolar RNA host gene 11 [Rattus norvegicus]